MELDKRRARIFLKHSPSHIEGHYYRGDALLALARNELDTSKLSEAILDYSFVLSAGQPEVYKEKISHALKIAPETLAYITDQQERRRRAAQEITARADDRNESGDDGRGTRAESALRPADGAANAGRDQKGT